MNCIVKHSTPLAVAPESDVFMLDPARPLIGLRGGRTGANPLDRALVEAQGVRQRAEEEAERLQREAVERGYRDGLESVAEQRVASMREIKDLKESILAEREAFYAIVEPQVVKLIMEIAEKILRRELETRPESVLDIVKFSLQQLTDKEAITLRVNPADVEMVRAYHQSIRDSAGGLREIEIIEDRRVDRGGCIAESASGSLDARIKSQIAEITRVITEAVGDDDAGDTDSGPEQIQPDS